MTQSRIPNLDPIDVASQRVVESVTDFRAAAFDAVTVSAALRLSRRLNALITELEAVQQLALMQADDLCGRD